ncbi:hypothetical protein [Rhizobium sp. BR 362]|uniref:hypothetical protein n=1 Tax=Rhizobium sp. BR 362 TaxID=3040670 RepID=UPI002F42E693
MAAGDIGCDTVKRHIDEADAGFGYLLHNATFIQDHLAGDIQVQHLTMLFKLPTENPAAGNAPADAMWCCRSRGVAGAGCWPK